MGGSYAVNDRRKCRISLADFLPLFLKVKALGEHGVEKKAKVHRKFSGRSREFQKKQREKLIFTNGKKNFSLTWGEKTALWVPQE